MLRDVHQSSQLRHSHRAEWMEICNYSHYCVEDLFLTCDPFKWQAKIIFVDSTANSANSFVSTTVCNGNHSAEFSLHYHLRPHQIISCYRSFVAGSGKYRLCNFILSLPQSYCFHKEKRKNCEMTNKKRFNKANHFHLHSQVKKSPAFPFNFCSM